MSVDRSVRDTPTLFVRKGLGPAFNILTVSELRDLLTRSEIPDEWEVMPNGVGNLAVFRPVTFEGRPTRTYAGYIDLVRQSVHLDPEAHWLNERRPPGEQENSNLHRGTIEWVDGDGHESNRP